MWNTIGTNISMAEGDYGIALPVKISGTTLGAQDSIRITFKDAVNGNVILVKDYDEIAQNTIALEFSEAESALFPIGNYVFALDWYQDGNFMCNIILAASMRVVDKA